MRIKDFMLVPNGYIPHKLVKDYSNNIKGILSTKSDERFENCFTNLIGKHLIFNESKDIRIIENSFILYNKKIYALYDIQSMQLIKSFYHEYDYMYSYEKYIVCEGRDSVVIYDKNLNEVYRDRGTIEWLNNDLICIKFDKIKTIINNNLHVVAKGNYSSIAVLKNGFVIKNSSDSNYILYNSSGEKIVESVCIKKLDSSRCYFFDSNKKHCVVDIDNKSTIESPSNLDSIVNNFFIKYNNFSSESSDLFLLDNNRLVFYKIVEEYKRLYNNSEYFVLKNSEYFEIVDIKGNVIFSYSEKSKYKNIRDVLFGKYLVIVDKGKGNHGNVYLEDFSGKKYYKEFSVQYSNDEFIYLKNMHKERHALIIDKDMNIVVEKDVNFCVIEDNLYIKHHKKTKGEYQLYPADKYLNKQFSISTVSAIDRESNCFSTRACQNKNMIFRALE